MTGSEIKVLALLKGFPLEAQPDGKMDLAPGVYAFAREIADTFYGLPVTGDPQTVVTPAYAETIDSILDEFCHVNGTDRKTAVVDLLVNLMHWCDREGISIRESSKTAVMHYRAETEEEEM